MYSNIGHASWNPFVFICQDDLKAALNVQPDRYMDRAVKSIPSRVTNISDHLVDKIEIEEFQKRIYHHILNTMESNVRYTYNKLDLKKIGKLRDSKFSTWQWNFGYSPRYHFNKVLKHESVQIELSINVAKGIIQEVNIEGDFESQKDLHALKEVMVGTIHDPETLRLKLSGLNVSDYISGLDNEQLLSGMF